MPTLRQPTASRPCCRRRRAAPASCLASVTSSTCLRAYYRHVAVDDLSAAGPTGSRLSRPARAAGRAPAAGPRARRGQARRRRRARPARRRHRHRDRRHAVPGRLDHDGAGQPWPLGPAGRAPAAACPPGRDRRAARDRRPGQRRSADQASCRPRATVGRPDQATAATTAGQPSHDELAESWTHIEIPPLGRTARPRHSPRTCTGCSATSGSRSRTTPGCERRAAGAGRRSAGAGRRGRAGGADAPAEIAELLRWLADGHFTFLGYREYDLVDGPEGMALSAVPGTGPRHPAARPGRSGLVRAAAGGSQGAGARTAAADRHQGQLPVHRAPAELPGLRRGEAAIARRRDRRGVPVPRPLHARRVLREHQEHPGAAAQARRGTRGVRHGRRQP